MIKINNTIVKSYFKLVLLSLTFNKSTHSVIIDQTLTDFSLDKYFLTDSENRECLYNVVYNNYFTPLYIQDQYGNQQRTQGLNFTYHSNENEQGYPTVGCKIAEQSRHFPIAVHNYSVSYSNEKNGNPIEIIVDRAGLSPLIDKLFAENKINIGFAPIIPLENPVYNLHFNKIHHPFYIQLYIRDKQQNQWISDRFLVTPEETLIASITAPPTYNTWNLGYICRAQQFSQIVNQLELQDILFELCPLDRSIEGFYASLDSISISATTPQRQINFSQVPSEDHQPNIEHESELPTANQAQNHHPEPEHKPAPTSMMLPLAQPTNIEHESELPTANQAQNHHPEPEHKPAPTSMMLPLAQPSSGSIRSLITNLDTESKTENITLQYLEEKGTSLTYSLPNGYLNLLGKDIHIKFAKDTYNTLDELGIMLGINLTLKDKDEQIYQISNDINQNDVYFNFNSPEQLIFDFTQIQTIQLNINEYNTVKNPVTVIIESIKVIPEPSSFTIILGIITKLNKRNKSL